MAAVPPKLTAVTPVKLVPVMTTVDPLPPLVGVKEVIVGAWTKVNPARVAVPPGVVKLTLPDDPEPTVAVTWVTEFTVNAVAAVPPKLTAVVPVRKVPVMTMLAPLPPLVGVNEVMVGVPVTTTLNSDE